LTQNRVEIEGSVEARNSVRYTPAGIPIIELKIAHVSEQLEAGKPRKLAVEIAAVAAGEVAQKLGHAPLGAAIRASGFLAHRGKSRIQLILHITAFEYI